MAGLPGAGKSTLARTLGSELRWQIIDKDRYREELLEQGVDGEYAARCAYDRSFAELRNVLVQQRHSVIFDTAALHRFILDTAREIVDQAQNARLKVILCVADRDLRNQRLRARTSQITKIRVDPATLADYFSYFRHLPPDTLTLYTSRPFEECLDRARAYVTGATAYGSKLAHPGMNLSAYPAIN